MPTIEHVRKLLDNLNPFCKEALERAIKYCIKKNNSELTCEHFLLQCLIPYSDVYSMLKYKIFKNIEYWSSLWSTKISRLDVQKNNNRPIFSNDFIITLEKSVEISNFFNFKKIRSGIFFISYLHKPKPYLDFDNKILIILLSNILEESLEDISTKRYFN